jgi:hypothetical protein
MKEELKIIHECIDKLVIKQKNITEKGDNRYPKSFIEGYICGLSDAILDLQEKIESKLT